MALKPKPIGMQGGHQTPSVIFHQASTTPVIHFLILCRLSHFLQLEVLPLKMVLLQAMKADIPEQRTQPGSGILTATVMWLLPTPRRSCLHQAQAAGRDLLAVRTVGDAAHCHSRKHHRSCCHSIVPSVEVKLRPGVRRGGGRRRRKGNVRGRR